MSNAVELPREFVQRLVIILPPEVQLADLRTALRLQASCPAQQEFSPTATRLTATPEDTTFEGPLERIPVGRTEMMRVYGDIRHSYDRHGNLVVSREWERSNMVLARGLPFAIPKLYVHRLVEPYLREGLRRAEEACPDYRLERIGCFAPRHQRHDRSRPLSDHSWGIAVDIDSERNRPRGVTRHTYSATIQHSVAYTVAQRTA
jgi:hypothetical protein